MSGQLSALRASLEDCLSNVVNCKCDHETETKPKALRKQRRWFPQEAREEQQPIPAGRCPPLVSSFSFGGDDMTAVRKKTQHTTVARREQRDPVFLGFSGDLVRTLQSPVVNVAFS